MNPYKTANKSKLPGIRSVAYCYMAMGIGDGMLLTSVTAKREDSDYYGRPGYPLSHRGGTGQYVWNSAGLLKADSARQIKIIHYNPLALPGQINFNDGSCLGISRVVVRTDFSFIQAPGASGFVGRGDDAVAEVGGKLGFEGVEFDEFLHGEAHG